MTFPQVMSAVGRMGLRSRMAGSEHSTSKTPGLAERPLSGIRDDRNGHNPEIARGGKRSFKQESAPMTADLRVAAVGGAAAQ
jgi:hypothetical protein